MTSEAASASPAPAVARSVTSAMSMSMTDLWLHLRTSVLLYTVLYLSTCFLVGLTSVAFHVFVVGAMICVVSFFRLLSVGRKKEIGWELGTGNQHVSNYMRRVPMASMSCLDYFLSQC